MIFTLQKSDLNTDLQTLKPNLNFKVKNIFLKDKK